MKILYFLLLFSFLNLSHALIVKGKAYRDGKLIYTELHFPTILNDGSYEKLKTEYKNDVDLKFAEITSDFTLDPFIPNVSFYDNRFNFNEKTYKPKDDNLLSIEHNKNNKVKKSSLVTKDSSILGQGFHNFIIKNFDKILKNDVDVHFIITSKSDQYHFKLYCEKKSQNEVVIKGKIDNFFLRAFVDEIVLIYSLPDKRLKKFIGLSNLDDNNGKSQKVEINYEYLD